LINGSESIGLKTFSSGSFQKNLYFDNVSLVDALEEMEKVCQHQEQLAVCQY
jgi:hypothetical protein